MKKVNPMKRGVYPGLFLVSLAIITYEVLLTRIFSTTMWYHFAYVAISVAMFGISAGAVIVYLAPQFFSREKTAMRLGQSAFLFGVTVVLSFLVHLCIPFIMYRSLLGVFMVVLQYAVISVPFVFGGICIALVLTRYPEKISSLYGVDLAGAALGCLFFFLLLRVTDGPTGVVVVAALGCLGAFFFVPGERAGKAALIVALCLGCFAGFNTYLYHQQKPLIRLAWIKGQLQHPPPYVRWTSTSRIVVRDSLKKPMHQPYGWGVNNRPAGQPLVRQLLLVIDGTAGTWLTSFDGNLKSLEFLKYDVVNVAHHLRPESDVLVIGVGGGADLLSSLAFRQKSVLGVEYNQEILKTLNRVYGDFTGHLDRYPQVRLVNDEGRSYLARTGEKFDLVQVSHIDTFAATVAGAHVLVENSLYTVQAWDTFIEHLRPGGIFTVSRFYHLTKPPTETYRLTALAVEALARRGIKDPEKNLVIIRCPRERDADVATMLICNRPFTPGEIKQIQVISDICGFTVIQAPGFSIDPVIGRIIKGPDREAFLDSLPVNLTAPTDNSPFFFNNVRFRSLFNRDVIHKYHQYPGFFTMLVMPVVIFLLVVSSIAVPLLMSGKRRGLKGSLPLFAYFGAIGLAFMFIEISQMQRLIVFLGHPAYGLSVLLFTLLISGGVGSFLTGVIRPEDRIKPLWFFAGLLTMVLLFGLFTPVLVERFRQAATGWRILISVAVLFPLGTLMGTAFPLGMKRSVALDREGLTPWLWGVNGAASVFASVFASLISIGWGISTTFWTGFACYIAAVLAFHLSSFTCRQEA